MVLANLRAVLPSLVGNTGPGTAQLSLEASVEGGVTKVIWARCSWRPAVGFRNSSEWMTLTQISSQNQPRPLPGELAEAALQHFIAPRFAMVWELLRKPERQQHVHHLLAAAGTACRLRITGVLLVFAREPPGAAAAVPCRAARSFRYRTEWSYRLANRRRPYSSHRPRSCWSAQTCRARHGKADRLR